MADPAGSSAGHVYVIETEAGDVKIGRSVSPDKRIRGIKTGLPVPIARRYISPRIYGYAALETAALRRFPRKTGEWVCASFDDVVGFLEAQPLETAEDDEAPGLSAEAVSLVYTFAYHSVMVNGTLDALGFNPFKAAEVRECRRDIEAGARSSEEARRLVAAMLHDVKLYRKMLSETAGGFAAASREFTRHLHRESVTASLLPPASPPALAALPAA